MSSLPTLRRRALIVLRDFARFGFNQVLLRCCPSLANALYERLSHRALKFLLGHGVIGQAGGSYDWEILLKNGRSLRIAVNPEDRFSTGCAFEYKVHDAGLKRTQEFFLDRGGERSLYLDIGANIGVSSLYALSSGMRCWLFEPNTELHVFGRSLYTQNGFTKARWEPVALSDGPGEARFFVSKTSFLSSFDRQNAEREGEVKEIVVPMRTLDSYLDELRGAAEELIVKIDVEGHEMNVLKGGVAVLQAFQPAVMIELLQHAESRRAAWAWFKVMNYVGYGIYDEPVLKLQALKSVEDLIAFSDINFVFLPTAHRLRAELEMHA